MAPRWYNPRPLSWHEHMTIQRQDYLFSDGISELSPQEQCHTLMSRCAEAISCSIVFPSRCAYPIRVLDGNAFAKDFAYFLVAKEAIETIRRNNQVEWADSGFIKIANVSATSIEGAVMGNLSVYERALRYALDDLSVFDETPFTAETAQSVHARICHHLNQMRWPTDAHEVEALVNEMCIRLRCIMKQSIIPDAKIPADKRTKAMSKQEALNYIGRPMHCRTDRQALHWFNKSIDDGEYRCEKLSHKSFVFHIDDFPPEVRNEIRKT